VANDAVHVTQITVELVVPYVAPSPATPTGAGVSQDVVEVLFADGRAEARLSQGVVEALVALPTNAPVHASQIVVEVLYPHG